MLRKLHLLLVFLSFAFTNSSAQAIYDSLLTELNSKYPQEKLYIQTDKSFYNPGETVWLKAYIKSDNFPTAISSNIYAELIDEKNNILKRKVMPVTILGANFDFEIPDSTVKSRLYLRAYTSWMLNFNDAYSKAINIIQPQITNKSITANYTLSFFPEGGDLVTDIESKVAFKTNDEKGMPFNIKGNILNEEGKTIVTFQSAHDGMGVFKFIPEAGKSYKAVWKDPKGILHETATPKSRTEAATLSVIQKDDRILFTIKRPQQIADELKEFTIIGQMNQQIAYAARINFKIKTEVTAPIPIDSLNEGILQLTLFNKNQEPVAERIIYVNGSPKQFITDLNLTIKNIKPKGKNQLQIDVGDELKSNLSIAVTDDSQSPAVPYSSNILSEFLMSSDLRGYIHNPGYYFSSNADSIKQHLDLVMMTNGWRRFKWEDLLGGKWPQIKYMPDNYLSIEGNIFGLTDSELSGRSITGFLKSNKDLESTSLLNLEADKTGYFKADNLYFFDTVKIFYQLNNDKNKRLTNKASFSFKTGFIESPKVDWPQGLVYSYLPIAVADINAKNFSLLKKEEEENQKIKMLENVTVSGKIKSPEEKINEEYASGLFSSGNSRIFAVENDPLANSYRSVLDYLQGKVAGLQISTNGFSGSVSRRGSPTSFFLNEMNTEADLILSTPMSDVAMIKVFDPPFVGAVGGGAGGAIAVYTKKGSSKNTNVQGLNVALIHGYSKFKEFYSPNYDNGISNSIDLRSTIYWNPNIFLDSKNKRAVLTFFNNSKAKKIRVILEGINESGQVTREEKVFE